MTLTQPLRFTRIKGRRWAAALLALLLVGAGIAQPASAAPTGTLTVMIITTSGQKLPLPNVVVALDAPGQPAASQLTDALGQATFTGLQEGSQYNVEVAQRGDHGAWTRLSNHEENVQVVAGQHRWLALRMRLAGSIGGRIVNQSGVPVADTMVRAYGAVTHSSEHDYTDADGYYVIRSLPTDDYRVEIARDSGSPLIIRRVVAVSAQHGDVAQTAVDYINGILQQPY